MKKGSVLFLKSIVCLLAIGVLTSLIVFPQQEGRAVDLDLLSIYRDPFILYIYFSSIPFFMALYQTFKLLGLIDNNQFFTPIAIRSIQHIKYNAFALIGFLIIVIFYIRFFAYGDDSAGPTMMGLLFLIIALTVVAICEVLVGIIKSQSEQMFKK